jgi:ADP-ribose pyrophosphatase YjhB (NUDIX family)
MLSDSNCVAIELPVSYSYIEETRNKIEEAGSPAEVVMVIPFGNGKVLLHTKSFYPSGVYRLPTGKMLPNEDPSTAFIREFREEIGSDGKIDRLLGIIKTILRADGEPVEFTSYVYLAKELTQEPNPQDGEEQITGFEGVPICELKRVAENLRTLPGRWRDWGKFRAIAHDFAADALKKDFV